jgi:hypothetical protein
MPARQIPEPTHRSMPIRPAYALDQSKLFYVQPSLWASDEQRNIDPGKEMRLDQAPQVSGFGIGRGFAMASAPLRAFPGGYL